MADPSPASKSMIYLPHGFNWEEFDFTMAAMIHSRKREYSTRLIFLLYKRLCDLFQVYSRVKGALSLYIANSRYFGIFWIRNFTEVLLRGLMNICRISHPPTWKKPLYRYEGIIHVMSWRARDRIRGEVFTPEEESLRQLVSRRTERRAPLRRTLSSASSLLVAARDSPLPVSFIRSTKSPPVSMSEGSSRTRRVAWRSILRSPNSRSIDLWIPARNLRWSRVSSSGNESRRTVPSVRRFTLKTWNFMALLLFRQIYIHRVRDLVF